MTNPDEFHPIHPDVIGDVRDNPDELPDDVRDALLSLAVERRPLALQVRAWDAWVTVAVIQFAVRNPQLSPTQRDQAIRVGRALQRVLVEAAPNAALILEAGWDTSQDVPRRER